MNLKSMSNFISTPCAILVLIFFFLPWISISCSDIKLADSSGFQLASEGVSADEMEANMASMSQDMMMEGFSEFSEGDFSTEFSDPTATFPEDSSTVTSDSLSSSEEPGFMKADAKLYAIPLIGLVALGLAGAGIYQSRFLNMYSAAGGFIVPSLLGIGLMVMKYLQIRGDMSDATGEMEGEFGGAIIGVNYEIGWWLSAAGLILIFIAGVLVFLETEEVARKLTPAERIKLEEVDGLLAQQRFAEAQAILQTIDHPIARQVLKKLNAPKSAPSAAASTSNDGGEAAKLQQAKDLIIQKRYSEARMILYSVQNPTAQKWLAKLDEIEKK